MAKAKTTKKRGKKGLDKKHIGYIIAGFGVFLLGGIVWAASTGTLQINGSVTRGGNVDLDFVSTSCVNPSTGYGTAGVTSAGLNGGDFGCGVTVSDRGGAVNGANDVLKWGMYLSEPGKAETVTFTIRNVGSVDANLAAASITSSGFDGDTEDNSITLGGTHTELAVAQCIAVGETAGPYTMTATWPSSETGATGDAELTAILNYAEAAGGCE